MSSKRICTKSSCFFCIMKDQDSAIKRATLQDYLKGLPFLDDDDDEEEEELILVVSELWKIAMTRPEDDELLSAGILECMAKLLNKAMNDKSWLLKHQNIYIPYYAAHIVGSYTMNKADHAARAVDAGVVPPLMELLRGRKMSWVEQRVAVRALGHLASYDKTFEAVAAYEEEVVKLAMDLAVSCLEEVYTKFVGVEDRREKAKLKYQCNLLTRGGGGAEAENRKAEEWGSQLQCWSIHLLNCFAVKERCLHLMCEKGFLERLCQVWGGLANHASPAGVGLIRILCYTKFGREKISRSKHVIENLCNISRSSDDWQYMAIDCLLLLLKDPASRYEVVGAAASYLADLVELRSLGSRANVGEAIARALLLQDCSKFKNPNVQRSVEEIWVLKVERRRREKLMSREKLHERRVMAKLMKQQGNHSFLVGDVEEAVLRYGEALGLCPLRFGNERIMLYCSRANCHLVLRNTEAAISDATRALCLSNPPNSHGGSLWIRSQAYDMKGMAKESLMDCIIFINVCIKSEDFGLKFPYHAVGMISKQMEATWLFREAHIKALRVNHHHAKEMVKEKEESDDDDEDLGRIDQVKNKNYGSGLSTILEESCFVKDGIGMKKVERVSRRSSKTV